MPQIKDKSAEELRFEDYKLGKKNTLVLGQKNNLLLAAVQTNDGEAVLRVVSEQGVDVRARVPEVINSSASPLKYPTVSRPARTAK